MRSTVRLSAVDEQRLIRDAQEGLRAQERLQTHRVSKFEADGLRQIARRGKDATDRLLEEHYSFAVSRLSYLERGLPGHERGSPDTDPAAAIVEGIRLFDPTKWARLRTFLAKVVLPRLAARMRREIGGRHEGGQEYIESIDFEAWEPPVLPTPDRRERAEGDWVLVGTGRHAIDEQEFPRLRRSPPPAAFWSPKVLRFVDRLPGDDRMIVRWRWYYAPPTPQAEIAKALGVSQPAVAKRLIVLSRMIREIDPNAVFEVATKPHKLNWGSEWADDLVRDQQGQPDQEVEDAIAEWRRNRASEDRRLIEKLSKYNK